jgi:hypothetical protein
MARFRVMRILVAGGSGLVGRALVGALLGDGNDVVVLSRDSKRALGRVPEGCRVIEWDGGHDPSSRVDVSWADVIVNLCGVPVGPQPWTRGRKRQIVASRIQPADALVRSIAALEPGDRPAAYVSAAGTDWYTDRDAVPATEDLAPPTRRGRSPDDTDRPFLRAVCEDWEDAALRAKDLGLRVALLRTSFVLAPGADLLSLLALPFRLWLGGPLGSGEQWFSWVHIDDVVGLYRLAVGDVRIHGAVNVASPEPCHQREFAAAIGQALGRPSWLPVPARAIRLALGAQATLALGSRRVLPARALELGYTFMHDEVVSATARALKPDRPVAAMGTRES